MTHRKNIKWWFWYYWFVMTEFFCTVWRMDDWAHQPAARWGVKDALMVAKITADARADLRIRELP